MFSFAFLFVLAFQPSNGYETIQKDRLMARKTNYGYEKRQKEIAKKAKKEEKKNRKNEQELQTSVQQDTEQN